MKGFDLIILGPQGSGKGTQASLLAKRFNLVVISSGAVFREIAKEDSELGRQINEIINQKGQLVTDELTAEVMERKIRGISSGKGIILDGFPRTPRQYQLLKEFWGSLGRGDLKALFIELSEDTAVKRLATRFVCERCGEIYIGKGDGNCTKCGGRLIEREDDKPETIKRRLQLFNALTLPMVAEMEKDSKVIRIDGAPSIEVVHQEILEKLNLS